MPATGRIKVALSQAVKSSIIVSRTKMGGLITAENAFPAPLWRASMTRRYTEKKQMLWNRADSNIEPSAYDSSAPAASSSSPKAAAVTLTARDGRDLGDENDVSSGRPDASADDSASTARKRDKVKSQEVLLRKRQINHPRGCAGPSSQQTLNPSLVIARYAWWNMCPGRQLVQPVGMNLSLWMNQAR